MEGKKQKGVSMKGPVIIGCEESQVVTAAFRKRGIDAYSCDLQPPRINADWHYQCDLFEALADREWAMGIFHPPCTYLSNSGVRWLYLPDGTKNEERWESMRQGAEFFRRILKYPMPCKAVENPVIHRYAREIIGRGHDQIIQPYGFGHPESKKTCLWLDELPPLEETNNVKHIYDALPDRERQRIWYVPPGPDRQKIRSTTFPGIADAFADQWGMYEPKIILTLF